MGQATTRRPVHNLSCFPALAFATRSRLNCRPSSVSRSQQREQNTPRAPIWVMLQAGQIGRFAGGSRPD
jgi:hypothetical protein